MQDRTAIADKTAQAVRAMLVQAGAYRPPAVRAA